MKFNLYKKWILIFLSFVLLSSFSTSCSKSDNNSPESSSQYASPYWPLGPGNSNMPSSGTLISEYSDSPEDLGIANLVDANIDTKFQTPHMSFEITWNGNSNVAVKSYSLTSSDDLESQDPKDWILSASKDSKNWFTIDEQENQLFNRKEVKTYDINNNIEYRYYKLSILNNNGGSNTQISEFKLSSAVFVGNIDDLMFSSSGDTYTADTPMGTQHLNDLTATDEQLEWLKDPTKEPDTFAGLSWSTFSVGSLYPFGTPLPADVNQHSIGDCCAAAVMSSMSYLFPTYIKHIIKDNGDNTYTVQLYDPQGKEVEIGVDNYFVGDGSNIGAACGKNNKVTWATVLEKAIIKWHQVYNGTPDIGGIGTEYVAAILTGNGSSFAFSIGKLDASDLSRAAIVSLQQRQIVIGGFSKSDQPVESKYKTVAGHAYTFMQPLNSLYLFTMRNPWGALPLVSGGYSDGKDDGLMNISADDDNIVSLIDLRICNPGAARGYAISGNLESYTPPAFSASPIRVSSRILYSGE